jgi:chromosome segregation ATPase|tara:strand:- start:158 stop:622 length:465 start_codon:yes stop_codon:yes gene_type:complete
MKQRSSKIYKPRTYKRKITALEKIIAVQNDTIAIKDKTIKGLKEQGMMKDGKYHAELKHRQEAEKAEVLAQEFGDRIRRKFNRAVLAINNIRDDRKAAKEEAANAEARCEELADRNCELLDEIEAFKQTIEDLKEEIEQKEKITEGNYDEDNPN